MKKKLNISGDSVKQFLFQNGEKIVLGFTVVILLLFLISAFSSKPLDETKSPDAIQQASRQVTDRIHQDNWPQVVKEFATAAQKPDYYVQQVALQQQPVPDAAYKFGREINPLLFPLKTKRADPQVFPVEELQIATGRGIVPYGAAPGAGGMNPQPGFVAPPIGGPPPIIGAPQIIGAPPIVGGAPGIVGAPNQRTQLGAGVAGVQAPGAEPKAKYYAVITGAIPFAKEVSEYGKRFDYALPAIPESADATNLPGAGMAFQQNDATDFPVWYWFQVERAEVQDAQDTNRKWVRLYQDAVKDLFDNWGIKPPQTPEIVNVDYLLSPQPYANQKYPYLFPTWPLPPLYLKNWGMEASHPKVKLIATDAATEDQPAEAQQTFNLGQNDTDAALPGGAPLPAAAPGAAPPQAAPRPVQPRVVAPPMIVGRPAVVGRDHDTFSGGIVGAPRGNMFVGPGGMIPPMMNPMGTMPSSQANSVVNKLFRFVDLSAEPGKTYRYRVQLILKNPNFNLQAQCLADPKSAANKTLSSAWVEIGPVTIPQEFQLLADSVAGGRGQEPRAKMSVIALVKTTPPANGPVASTADYWLEVKKDIDLSLGGIPDLRNDSFKDVPDPSAGQVRDIDKATIDTHDTMLVDLRNDDPLGAAKSKGPTEVLIIDSTGRLRLASSAADSLTAADYKDRTTAPAADAGAGTLENGPPAIKTGPARPAPYGRGAVGPRGGGPGPAGAKGGSKDHE